MSNSLKAAMGIVGMVVATHAAAQVTFYSREQSDQGAASGILALQLHARARRVSRRVIRSRPPDHEHGAHRIQRSRTIGGRAEWDMAGVRGLAL